MKEGADQRDQRDLVRCRDYNEWETFIDEILDYDKQVIVDMCDKILFYDCVVILFLGNERLSRDDICFLLRKEHIISHLWLTYLEHEKNGLLTWPELLKLWPRDERED